MQKNNFKLPMGEKDKTRQKLSFEEWNPDFESKIPDWQLMAMLHYEYARCSKLMLKAVSAIRDPGKSSKAKEFLLPFANDLARQFPEFPKTPWGKITLNTRLERLAILGINEQNGLYSAPLPGWESWEFFDPEPQNFKNELTDLASESYGIFKIDFNQEDSVIQGLFYEWLKKRREFLLKKHLSTVKLAKILELNPELHKTVWTTWHRIIFIWLRITGWRPRNCALAGCLWIAAGIIPAVEVADATHYCNGFPVTDRGNTFMTIKFSDLKWPKILHEPFLLERLEGQYGQLFQTGPRRRESFSFQTAAQFFAATLRLKYSRRAESFTICSEAGEPTPVQTSTLTDFISEWLHAKVETAAVRFPAGDPVTSIITALKDICVIEKTDELNGLLNFLRERLERKAGSSLTTKEMFDHYLAYCKASGAAIYPERAFYKRLAVEMKYLYQACKAHDIKRSNQNGGSTDKYGFHHVAIKSIALEAADASESTEPPEACQVGSKFA